MVLKRPAMNRIRGRGHPDIFVVIIAKKQRRRVDDGVKERKTIGPQKPAREMSTLHQTAICLPISLPSSVSISLFYSCLFFLSLFSLSLVHFIHLPTTAEALFF